MTSPGGGRWAGAAGTGTASARPEPAAESPLIGVLALQGDVAEHLRMLRDVGARVRPVRRPAELAGLDGIVVPGGESTTMYKLARTFEVFEPLRAGIRSGLPAFGTCAGLILLAERLEGAVAGQETLGVLDVVARRNAFGRQVDSFEADLDVEGLDDPFHAVFIRAPWVQKAGPDVEVVARVAGGEFAGRIVAVRQGAMLATSFHPEITGDHRIHQLFVEIVRDRLAPRDGAPGTERK